MKQSHSARIRALEARLAPYGGMRAVYEREYAAGYRLEQLAEEWGISYSSLRWWIGKWKREGKPDGE